MAAGWIAILVAGILEIAWAHSIGQTDGFTKVMPTIVCGVLTVAVLLLLNHAMKTLPTGSAYAAFTGIGVIGTAAIGILFADESVSAGRISAICLIVAGVVLLHITSGGARPDS